MKDKKLKPCPFCGGKAELHTSPFTGNYAVTCTICKACMGYSYISDIIAIEQWTRRVI